MTVGIPFCFEALSTIPSQSRLGHFSREVQVIEIPRSTGNLRRELLVGHLRTGRDRELHILCSFQSRQHPYYILQ